jgi:chromosome segregation ATPase
MAAFSALTAEVEALREFLSLSEIHSARQSVLQHAQREERKVALEEEERGRATTNGLVERVSSLGRENIFLRASQSAAEGELTRLQGELAKLLQQQHQYQQHQHQQQEQPQATTTELEQLKLYLGALEEAASTAADQQALTLQEVAAASTELVRATEELSQITPLKTALAASTASVAQAKQELCLCREQNARLEAEMGLLGARLQDAESNAAQARTELEAALRTLSDTQTALALL